MLRTDRGAQADWDKKEKARESLFSSWKVCRRRFSLIAKHPLCGVSSVQCGGCVVWMHTIWVTQNSMKTQLVGWKCKISCNIAKLANCRDGWPSIGETLELVDWLGSLRNTRDCAVESYFAIRKLQIWKSQMANPTCKSGWCWCVCWKLSKCLESWLCYMLPCRADAMGGWVGGAFCKTFESAQWMFSPAKYRMENWTKCFEAT